MINYDQGWRGNSET